MTADVLFTNGTVWLGPGRRTTALAVTGGLISALGEDAVAAGADEVVDLAGGLLLPAFSDGHCHPNHAGLEMFGPAITGLDSVEAIVAEVGRYAAAHPELAWITGGTYDPALAPGGTFQASWLDAVVPDRPVMLKATDHHTAWVNTAALKLAGVDASTPEPETGVIERHSDGTPCGTLREPPAFLLVESLAPVASLETKTEALKLACASQAAQGLTWMQDAWVEAGDHLPYLELLRRGELTVRTNLAWLLTPGHWREEAAALPGLRAEVEAADAPELLTAFSVKFFADGVIESGTAEMLQPYDDSHHHGMPVWEPAELAAAVAAIDALGFQAHIHAIGDAAVQHSVDAIAHAVATNPAWDRRPVITHVQIAEVADLARFAALDITAAMQTFWAQQDPLMELLTAPRLGPERTVRQYQVGTMLDLDARVSIASDWPVSTNSPIEAITVAATRQTVDGLPEGGWVPEERLPLEDGLLAATAGGAYQGITDAYRGTLEVGKAADLTWLDRDITAAEPLAARQARVLGTWLGGARTHTL